MGVFNAIVISLGALIIGVPLAGTLGIVAWMMNYIPFFGAIVSGAFAALIAYGAGGLSMAIPMPIIVIIANGFLQTLVSQFARRDRRGGRAVAPASRRPPLQRRLDELTAGWSSAESSTTRPAPGGSDG